MERIVTVFKKVEWNSLDILKLIREAVKEAREQQPDTTDMKLGDIGLKKAGNHLQINLYFVNPPAKMEGEILEDTKKVLEVT